METAKNVVIIIFCWIVPIALAIGAVVAIQRRKAGKPIPGAAQFGKVRKGATDRIVHLVPVNNAEEATRLARQALSRANHKAASSNEVRTETNFKTFSVYFMFEYGIKEVEVLVSRSDARQVHILGDKTVAAIASVKQARDRASHHLRSQGLWQQYGPFKKIVADQAKRDSLWVVAYTLEHGTRPSIYVKLRYDGSLAGIDFAEQKSIRRPAPPRVKRRTRPSNDDE